MDRKKYWKEILGSIFILLLLAGIITCIVLYANANRKHGNSRKSHPSDAIIKACNQTQYPTLCITSLTNSNDARTANQIQLAQIAIKITLQKVNDAITALNKTDTTDTILRSAAHQLLDESGDLLEKSYTRIGQNLINESNADVLTWLSAVLTNQDTCVDGLEGADGEWKKLVEEHLNDLRETASFSLTLFSNSVLDMNLAPGIETRKNGRKLLSSGFSVDDTGFPTWLNRKDRRLLTVSDPRSRADYVVAQDGSGKYETIASAINDVPRNSPKRTIIYVKNGTYEEELNIGKYVENLMLVGDGPGKTIITGSKSVGGSNLKTYLTASFGISGSGFIAWNLTFMNNAGEENNNAVALRLSSDKSVVYRCDITGYQNTLYVHNQRQFFRECFISGTVDFIFGNGAVVLQKSVMLVKIPSLSQMNTITAQGRQQIDQNTCITIQNSTIGYNTALAKSSSINYYLGRPWKKFSRVMIIESFIDEYVNPGGWLRWEQDNHKDNTVYYGEYGNTGPGANVTRRVNWPGYHAFTSAEDVRPFGVDELISGSLWLPATDVPFTT